MNASSPHAAVVPACLLGVALLLTGCSSGDSSGQSSTEDSSDGASEQQSENVIPEPEYDGDDTVRLPLALVASAEQLAAAPMDDSGRITDPEWEQADPPHEQEIARSETFGCEDTISLIQTVPVVTEEPGHAALEFLLSEGSSSVGTPAMFNPSTNSSLEVDAVETEDGTVTVNLSGEPVVSDVCESWQVAKQLEVTARAATGADSAEILINDTDIHEVLGLEDEGALRLTEIVED